MATRTQKAAMKKNVEAGQAEHAQAAKKTAKEAKAAKAAAAKAAKAAKADNAKAPKTGKAAKPAKAKPAGKNRKSRKGELVFEDPQTGERIVAFEEETPSFFERFKQRRAEKAEARALEHQRRERERLAAEEHQRQVDEEQRVLREAQEREEAARRDLEERKAQTAARRAETKAAKEAEKAEAARREAEAAAALAAEEARKAEEKAAAQEAAKQKRAAERQAKREQLEAEERRLVAEQAAKDAEDEVERRRLAANKRLADSQREPEPDLEFQEPSKPVKDTDALVPGKGGASAVDAQADLVAAELSKRRSKPVVIHGDLPEPPRLPKATRPKSEGEEEVEVPVASGEPEPRVPAPQQEFGFALPEAFLLLANDGGWDERSEQNRGGSYGGALAGAMVLELLMRGAVMVQRDRFTLTGDAPGDAALVPIVDRLRRIREKKGDLPSLQQLGELAKWNRELLLPFKERLAAKGLVEYGSRRHLGLFHRSWVNVTNTDAQERLQNRLRRAIAGGGTPEAPSILLLGLLDASGLFSTVVPNEAADYNRKRLNGLLGGRDIMGYKVDPALKALQEIATRTVLSNARTMTVRG
ncbi:MAG: GPP34 family phosphoprotein [Candidatus Thermoplasmatota archaeon]|jgi:hypothetical protein